MKRFFPALLSLSLLCLTACASNPVSPEWSVTESQTPEVTSSETTAQTPDSSEAAETTPAPTSETPVETDAPEQELYDEMIADAGLTKEQGDRIDELLYALDSAHVSYSFDGAKDLGLTSLQMLVGNSLAANIGENATLRYSDMKGLLTEEQLLAGFEDLFGVGEIPFSYEFTDWQNHLSEPEEIPLTFLFQGGAQGLPEMGGLAAEFKILSVEKDGDTVTVTREMHFHNGEVYFYDTNVDTFYFRGEAEEKFPGEYDFMGGTKLPDGLKMYCFPSFVRTMEYTFGIKDDGHIFIRSGKVID